MLIGWTGTTQSEQRRSREFKARLTGGRAVTPPTQTIATMAGSHVRRPRHPFSFTAPFPLPLLFLTIFVILPLGNVCEEEQSPLHRRQKKTIPPRVLPGMASFPSDQEIYNVTSTLDGGIDAVIYATHASYVNATRMYNTRVLRFPMLVFYVRSVADVQKVVKFARDYNLMVSVRSSGHSYIGRSTHHGGVVINLLLMKDKQFRLKSTRGPAGEVTVESGNSWLEVYQAVDQQVTYEEGEAIRRVIVGASTHTVAMGGYTLGGGQSPIGRRLGMAVDNLVEATIVLADGRKAVVNAEGTTITDLEGNEETLEDTSLFWAIRGGGGGTWGVVTHFTFKLHFAPERIRRVHISWALKYWGQHMGEKMIKHVLRQLGRLSEDWGGYMIVSGAHLGKGASGHLTLSLNHFGSDDSASNSEVDDLLNYNPIQAQYEKNDTSFSTFLQYELSVTQSPSTNSYLYNTFIHNHTIYDDDHWAQLTHFLMGLTEPPTSTSLQLCIGALIGGRMKEVPRGATPVNPSFRSGLLSLSCVVGWSDTVHRDDFYIDKALEMKAQLRPLGRGVYFNEPDEDLEDWKEQFWGDMDTYNRLLSIKQTWDPDNFFWCHNCVGSDLNVTVDPGTSISTTITSTCLSSSLRVTAEYLPVCVLVVSLVWLLSFNVCCAGLQSHVN